MPSPENINALKEAIEKAKISTSSAKIDIKEEKPASAKSSGSAKEVPEDVLRKILKGE